MGWSYFPIGIVCPVISEEPEFLNRQLKTSLRVKGPMNHEETLGHAKEITVPFKSEKTPIRACFTNESTLYAQAA